LKITKITFGRTFNLGNYESARIELEAEVDVDHNELPAKDFEALKAAVYALKDKSGVSK